MKGWHGYREMMVKKMKIKENKGDNHLGFDLE